MRNWAPIAPPPFSHPGVVRVGAEGWQPPRAGAPRAQVGLCEPCAKGEACSCSTPCNCKKVKVAGIEVVVGGWAPRVLAQVGGFWSGERAIPWPHVQEFDALVRQLNTDIGTWTAADTSGGPDSVPKSLPFKFKWDAWFFKWVAWFAEHADPKWYEFEAFGHKVLIASALLEYDVMRAEYDELLREAQTLGVSTAAVQAPKDKAPISDAAKALGGDAIDLAGTIAKYGGLALLVVGVGYAGLLLLPTLSAGIARKVAA